MVNVEEVIVVEPGTEIQPTEQASSLKELSAEEKLALDATQWEQEVDDMYITKSDSSGTPEEMDIPDPQAEQRKISL